MTHFLKQNPGCYISEFLQGGPRHQRKEEPKLLYSKVAFIYETYVKEHLGILQENLGAQARNDASNLPPGVFCLFPGYWSDSRASAFAASCIKAPLGVHERIARSLLIKQFTPKKLRDWDIDPVAVSQAFGHSKEVEEGSYRYGLKNTVNALQAHVLGW